jgi:endonuclease III
MTIKKRIDLTIDYFLKNNNVAETELTYYNPFELMVAVILSAQCTDKRVNMITPSLIRQFPDAGTMAKAEPEEIFEYIKSCSYPNNKAKYLSGMSRMLVNEFGGTIPSDPILLERLPGVGRKTANVIASVVFHKQVMAVDTHVFRVSNRIGLVKNAKTPRSVEDQLLLHIPHDLIYKAHHWLLLHGRYVCKARLPLCSQCGLSGFCKFYNEKVKNKSRDTKNKKEESNN